MRIKKRIKSFLIFKVIGWNKRETIQFINGFSIEFVNKVTDCKNKADYNEIIKDCYIRYIVENMPIFD